MKKRVVLALVLVALVAGGAFAIDMSAGGGGLFDLSSASGSKIMAFGAYGFYDITYCEIDINFTYGLADGNMKIMSLGFGVLGKYPIALGSVTLFPLVGGDYNRVLSAKVEGFSFPGAGSMSQIGILGGLGADFGLSKSMFLRTEGLFHFRLPPSGGDVNSMGPRIKVGLGFKL